MITRFNQVSNWVATEVLKESTLKKRIDSVIWFIKLAEKCLELNNLNAVFEVVSGLSQGHIQRLKQTWAGVASRRQGERLLDLSTHRMGSNFENLRELVDRSNNHKNLRELIQHVTPPCVPYIGVYLTDLTFADEGNPDFITLPDIKLINFDKRRRLAKLILDLTKFQKTPYCLQVVPFLLKHLSHVPFMEEQELYKISLVLEPRKNP